MANGFGSVGSSTASSIGARNLAAMVQGRVVYEIMESSWPNIANDKSMPDYMQEYGRIWVDTPKVLVSRTRAEAGYNTRVVGGEDAMDQLAALRAGTDGDIGVGGAPRQRTGSSDGEPSLRAGSFACRR
ncbi:MAG: hypothetical protein L0Z49_02630 [Actinobacteria bacterium]|nr:hypothetical protein [Actinomycetota bacterium]